MRIPIHPDFRSQRGSALLIALGILLIVSLLGMASIETSRVEMNVAGNNVKRSQTFWVAEAGLAKSEAVLRANPRQANADTLMQLINASNTLADASFNVSMEAGLPYRKVISVGRGFESEAAVQVTYQYRTDPHNIWNNVLFAGHGQNGLSIQGNSSIHGSIHILGDGEQYQDLNGNGTWDVGEPFTDANHDGSYDGPLTADSVALDMTGLSQISNSYSGLRATLAARLPALPATPYAGENVQSLSSELRVQHGQVSLDGAASVGDPNVTGGTPAIKEPLDAVFVNDGFSGSAAEGSVYSDNGHEASYDLEGDAPVMPDLDAPYIDSDGLSHATYLGYLESNAHVISGDLEIDCNNPLPAQSSAKGNLSMDSFGNLTASGIIYVRGNIRIVGKCPITYSGRFTLVSEGDTEVDTDFYSRGKFALEDVAGLISYGRLDLGGGASQLLLAGACFAQEEVSTSMQTQLTGSIVSNFFNLRQVPDLFQVPLLVKHLPPGMPGSDDVYSYSWRRVPNSWTELY